VNLRTNFEVPTVAPETTCAATAQTSDQSSVSFSDSLLTASKADSEAGSATNAGPKATRQPKSTSEDAKTSLQFPRHSDSIADRFSAVSIATAGAIDEYCYSRSRGTSRCARYVLRCYGCYDRQPIGDLVAGSTAGPRQPLPIGCRRVSQQSVELLSARSRPFPKGADIIRLFN